MYISLLQTDIEWENKQANLLKLNNQLESLKGKSNLAVIPEMFTTGFSMNCHELAEDNNDNTVATLCELSHKYDIALTGSFIGTENDRFYNRGFFITPNGNKFFYDKHHLFRMGEETKFFSAGDNHLIVRYWGFNIALLICYDLRFPVWSRNVENGYDLLIYVANWPASRRSVWDTLLRARALENMSYVCGVNRIGIDGNGMKYNGGSILISPKGNTIASITDDKEDTITSEIDTDSLQAFRNKFPVWKDADKFSL